MKRKFNEEHLRGRGFKTNIFLSDEENTVLTKRYIVYRTREFACFDAEININITNQRYRINVFDHGTRAYYAAWYLQDRNNDVVKRINKEISNIIQNISEV